MRPSSSSERTPLVQPAYVFESSLSRSYQKRLRNFQCAICIGLMALLGVALLVTVSYNLSDDMSDDISTPIPETIIPGTPVVANLTAVDPDLKPLLKLSWPLKEQPPADWAGDPPSPNDITNAVTVGKAALEARTKVEKSRKSLDVDFPAYRAQRAAATAPTVKPLADNAYAAEQATKALANGTDSSTRAGGVGQGPPTNGSFPQPRYCLQDPPPCPESPYRTLDGTCNNLQHPYSWGVAGTPFRRVIPADYGDGISSPREGRSGPLPSARDVSVTVHRPSYAHDSQFTVMLAVWGQFVDHDITATALSKGENSSALSCCDWSQPPHPECFPVRLAEQDPFYQDYNVTCMEFVRSAPVPTCNFGPREQMNQATAFIDGSAVYGFAETRLNQLRAGAGLLRMLKIEDRELLPQSKDPNDGCNTVDMNEEGRYCFETGDDRANENLHLTTMHLLWARQHNRVGAELRRLRPGLSDDVTFQEARRVVAAQMQHITYAEFLPAVLGNDVMWALNLTLKEDNFSSAYDHDVNPTVANHFSAAVFRFAHTLLPGLIHAVDASSGSVNYVQLHEMLFNPFALYARRGPRAALRDALRTPVHSAHMHVTAELSNHLFEKPSSLNNSQSRPGPCGLDLVSLNIQRGRDHGLPAYPMWREFCGFRRPRSFEDLESVFDEMSFSRIVKIYGSVDDIDLYTGALAEEPHGRLLGPTLTCLIADQFYRLKVGDRFWYETDDPEIGFTIEQITEIRKTTLAGIICANEELLNSAQPRVMELVSPTNPLVDCKEIPQPDFTPWKEEKGRGTMKKSTRH